MSFYLLDRVVKSVIHSQSSNLSPSAIVRTSRCTGSLFNVAEQFDKLSLLHPQSSSHSEAKLRQRWNNKMDEKTFEEGLLYYSKLHFTYNYSNMIKF